MIFKTSAARQTERRKMVAGKARWERVLQENSFALRSFSFSFSFSLDLSRSTETEGV
jgi:hypothetical protein